MDLRQYIFPIYSGGTIMGQCFIADGYLITAAHVIKDFSLCFTRINGKRFEFPIRTITRIVNNKNKYLSK